MPSAPSPFPGRHPPAPGFVRLQEADLPVFYRRFLMAHAEPVFINLFRPMPYPTLQQFTDYFAVAKRPLWTMGVPATAPAYFGLHHFQREHALANVDFAFFTGYPAPGTTLAVQFRQALHDCLSEWGLTRLQSFVLATSADKIRLLESLGFRNEGLLREHYFHNGRFHDLAVHGWVAEGRDG